jgi:NADH-quinone oxidoreductase subunit A
VTWPLGVYFLAVLALVALILAASHVLGERHRAPAMGGPYESGVMPAGSARVRFSVQFYLVAAFFVLFDLEAVFIFAWSVVGRSLGWTAYLELVVFVAVLVAALAYLWRTGALDFGPRRPSTSERGARAP